MGLGHRGELVIQLLVVIITMEDIKKAIGEAEKELEVAERLVASKRSALMVLQNQLQDQLVKNVGGLKGVTSGGDKVKRNETEEERRARVRRRWRVLALKVKFGLGANVLAIKKRNLNDISTFIDQETEEATKEEASSPGMLTPSAFATASPSLTSKSATTLDPGVSNTSLSERSVRVDMGLTARLYSSLHQ